MQLERKLKTALDESRLLILGAQVLFGFQFQSVFQEGFRHLSAIAKSVQGAGLLLMLLTIGLLIAPSLYHQIVHGGESRSDALNVATWFAGASLLPLTARPCRLGLRCFRACVRRRSRHHCRQRV